MSSIVYLCSEYVEPFVFSLSLFFLLLGGLNFDSLVTVESRLCAAKNERSLT